MNCPSCNADNPEGARFCMQCGGELKALCANCQTELPAGAQFCFQCGAAVAAAATGGDGAAPGAPSAPDISPYIPSELVDKLESARASGRMRGERRVVTMLFSDVQGSTAAAERLDPEEWVEIMNGAFERLMTPVYKYEGTLASLMGDAILAFFGAPIAHEDDPQRAVLAGLDIIEAIGPYRESMQKRFDIDFNVRVGINTGLVVVGEIGSDLRVEYSALGDAVNLAARMEQTAAPGTVRIADATHRLIAPLFDFEDLGDVDVKGKADPVRAFRVVAPKAQPGSLRGIEGLESPLVGRDNDFEQLQEAVSELRQGRGQIVTVMGEAGLGKSRLVAEIRSSVLAESAAASGNGASPAGFSWLEGRSQSYQMETPYTPFIDLFSGFFDLRLHPNDQVRLAGIKERLASVSPGGKANTAAFLGTMLGLPLEGDDEHSVRYLSPPQLREQVLGQFWRPWRASHSGSRWCCCSTTSTGATRRRSS